MTHCSVRQRFLIGSVVFIWTTTSLVYAGEAPLKLIRTIPMAGVEGRIDHLTFDQSGQRLFVCALGNNSLEIIDLHKGKRVHSITGLGSPQGVGYIPDSNRILVANDRGGICKIYDGESYQQLGEINLGDDADNVRYDEAANMVYVGFGNGGLAVVSGSNYNQVESIKLSAHPEAFQLEKSGKRIFVNVPNSHQVAVIDRDQAKVIASWNTELAFANFPMVLDETNHRLFVGCRMPSRLLVFDTDSGQIANKINIAGDVDDIFYDTKRHRIYLVCGAGKLNVVQQTDPNNYRRLAEIETATGARTGLFVAPSDTVFVAVPHHGAQQAEIWVYQAE